MSENLKAFYRMINKRIFLIGLATLLLGTLVYLVDRPPDQIYFVLKSPINISLFKTLPNLFGYIGNILPSFIHVFSFILITASLISCRKNGYLFICLGWFLVDCAFEFGQKYKSLFSKVFPEWFESILFLENIDNYFRYGTFDYIDLTAITFGAVMAYFVLLVTNKNKRRTMS